MRLLRPHLLRRPQIPSADTSASAPTAPSAEEETQRRYRELRSLLRRNRRMFQIELETLSRRWSDARTDTLADLLLYEFLGYRTRRVRRRQAQLRKRQAELNRIHFALQRASAALDAGLLDRAELILRQTSRSLGILLDEDVARLSSQSSADTGSLDESATGPRPADTPMERSAHRLRRHLIKRTSPYWSWWRHQHRVLAKQETPGNGER
jgi:hypothetical protein